MDGTQALGKIFRKARKRQGLTQLALAAMLNIDQAIVSRVESSKMIPDFYTTQEWAKRLNCQDAVLFSFLGTDAPVVIQQMVETLSGVAGFISLIGVIT
ncbi:helix-turn-helix domain-containing protein [Geomicrobium sp. JCM 19037]|uniref:helix-turn-helix domain-containing protein n=1 Tax=Geomicrobium sp. JCM 19037 TaxID=1460634 RepID=UPI0005AB0004|nr:helix-turn-helix transcriptional regulator [Geomicrobium sp. JCM 19037]